MAFLGGTFDASNIEPDTGFEPIPAGDYLVMIVDSNMDTTKDGRGQYLKLQLQVIDGPHANHTLFDRLNLVNDNPKAVDIAQRTLSAICHAVGKLQVSDSTELHNLPLTARVTLRPAGPDRNGIERAASNEVKGYKAAGSAAPATPFQRPAPASASAPSAPAPQPVAAAASGATPPWMQGKTAAA